MAEKTEIIISVMPKLETKIVELSSKLEQIMAERAPEAWDAALGVVQVDAAGSIIIGICFLFLSAILWHISQILWRKSKSNPGEDWIIGCTIVGIFSAFTSITTFLLLLDPWLWVAFTNPELVIAKRILDGVL